MLKFEIIVTEEEVVLSAEGELALLHATREALEACASAGLDRDGQPILGRSGKPLDLHDTGRLWSDVTEAPAEGGLIFGAPYAQEVLSRYKADALNEASLHALEQKLSPLLDAEVTNKEIK